MSLPSNFVETLRFVWFLFFSFSCLRKPDCVRDDDRDDGNRPRREREKGSSARARARLFVHFDEVCLGGKFDLKTKLGMGVLLKRIEARYQTESTQGCYPSVPRSTRPP